MDRGGQPAALFFFQKQSEKKKLRVLQKARNKVFSVNVLFVCFSPKKKETLSVPNLLFETTLPVEKGRREKKNPPFF